MALAAATAVVAVGCSQQPAVKSAAINDKVYSVTPNAIKVKAGIVSGDLTEMKVTERVEDGTGRVTSPAKLTGKLVLKNVSADQVVRLVGGKIVYMDMQGKPIPLEDNRTAPTIKVSSQYGATEQRLDPGQDATQNLEVEFPVDALKAKRLRDIRLEVAFVPSPYREETLSFGVSIGGQ
jgi:hypothetical protein